MLQNFIMNQFGLLGIGGIAFIFGIGIILYIKNTESKKDDEVLYKYVIKGIEFALEVMPKDSAINSIKLTKNAMKGFIDAYYFEKGLAPDMSILKKAVVSIKEIAKQKELSKK